MLGGVRDGDSGAITGSERGSTIHLSSTSSCIRFPGPPLACEDAASCWKSHGVEGLPSNNNHITPTCSGRVSARLHRRRYILPSPSPQMGRLYLPVYVMHETLLNLSDSTLNHCSLLVCHLVSGVSGEPRRHLHLHPVRQGYRCKTTQVSPTDLDPSLPSPPQFCSTGTCVTAEELEPAVEVEIPWEQRETLGYQQRYGWLHWTARLPGTCGYLGVQRRGWLGVSTPGSSWRTLRWSLYA